MAHHTLQDVLKIIMPDLASHREVDVNKMDAASWQLAVDKDNKEYHIIIIKTKIIRRGDIIKAVALSRISTSRSSISVVHRTRTAACCFAVTISKVLNFKFL